MKLEQTILDLARQRLTELESFAKDHDDFDEVVMAYGRVIGLAELAHLVDSGLSSESITELEQIEQKASQILSEIPKAEEAH